VPRPALYKTLHRLGSNRAGRFYLLHHASDTDNLYMQLDSILCGSAALVCSGIACGIYSSPDCWVSQANDVFTSCNVMLPCLASLSLSTFIAAGTSRTMNTTNISDVSWIYIKINNMSINTSRSNSRQRQAGQYLQATLRRSGYFFNVSNTLRRQTNVKMM
jgi:hypothetical protein